MYGWNEHPSKLDVKHCIGGDAPARVFEVGSYVVTVPNDPEAQATYVHKHRHYEKVDVVFPNMSVGDGAITIPVDDFVPLILNRLDPADIAQALWAVDEVRARFIEAATSRYSESNIHDRDRRDLLAGLKKTVHSVALDRLADKLFSAEYSVLKHAHHWDEVGRINQILRDLDVKVQRASYIDGKHAGTEAVLLQFDTREQSVKLPDGSRTQRGELEIGGLAWEQAREFWRAEISKLFPAPAEDDTNAPDALEEIPT